jgi:hypothetical protein
MRSACRSSLRRMSIALTSITARSPGLLQLGHRAAQRFKNAYLDGGQEGLCPGRDRGECGRSRPAARCSGSIGITTATRVVDQPSSWLHVAKDQSVPPTPGPVRPVRVPALRVPGRQGCIVVSVPGEAGRVCLDQLPAWSPATTYGPSRPACCMRWIAWLRDETPSLRQTEIAWDLTMRREVESLADLPEGEVGREQWQESQLSGVSVVALAVVSRSESSFDCGWSACVGRMPRRGRCWRMYRTSRSRIRAPATRGERKVGACELEEGLASSGSR